MKQLLILRKKINRHVVGVQAIFLLIAIGYGMFYIITKKGLGGDGFFNYLRLKEIDLDILHGQYPQFNLYTGYLLGGATSTYYPWLFFLPAILFMSVLNPFTWWGCMIMLGMFIGLNITYYVGFHWLGRRRAALALSLLYCLSTVQFSVIYSQCDMASFYAMMIAPLVFYSWRCWLLKGHWRLLAVSLALITYVHILTALILGTSFLLLTVFLHRFIHERNLIGLSKAVISYIGLTCVLWLPIVVLSASNHIFLPSQQGTAYMATQMPLLSWKNFVIPSSANMWDIVTVTALIMALAYRHKMTLFNKASLVLTGIYLVMNQYDISKWLIGHTFLEPLQFTHRLCFVTIFLMSLLIVQVSHKISHHWAYIDTVIIISIISLILGFLELNMSTNGHAFVPSPNKNVNLLRVPYNYASKDLTGMQYLHSLPYRYPDYYPNQLVGHIKYHHVLSLKPRANFADYTPSNTLNIFSSRHKVVCLASTYHQQRYQVYDNRRRTKFYTYRHRLIILTHAHRNHIQIFTPVMWYRYISALVSVLSVIVLVLTRRNDRSGR